MDKITRALIYLLILLQTNFFSFQPSWFFGLNSYTSKYFTLGLVLLILIVNISNVYKAIMSKGIPFKFPVSFLFLVTIITEIWSTRYYQQGFNSSLTASYYIYIIALYFFLITLLQNVEEINRILRFIGNVGALYSTMLIIQGILMRYNIAFMNTDDAVLKIDYGSTFLGFNRVKSPADFISFSILALIVYVILHRKRAIVSFVYMGLDLFYVVFISQTRMYIIVDVILIVIFILSRIDKVNHLLAISILSIAGMIGFFGISDLFLEFTSGSRAISYSVRMDAIRFYFGEMPKENLLGIGFPNTFETYDILHSNLLTLLGYQYYLDDIGILGFLVVFGVMGFIVLFLILYELIKLFIKATRKWLVLLPIWYLLSTSISLSLLNVQRIVYLPFVLFLIAFLSQGDNVTDGK